MPLTVATSALRMAAQCEAHLCFASNLREALPNESFIGFTGTPSEASVPLPEPDEFAENLKNLKP